MKRNDEEKKTRKVTIRFTPTEFANLEKKLKKTTCAEISQYIRNLSLAKPVIIKYRNESLDSFMEEVILLRQELKAIGHNVNQSVKKLHPLHQIAEFRTWINGHEKIFEELSRKTELIQQRINEITDKWLQE